MSCGCKKRQCNDCSCSKNCAEVCTALQVDNSWTIPTCSGSAVLSVPVLSLVMIGSYIFNPSYGWFKITGWDSVNGQITILNECQSINSVPGTVVPAETIFVFGAPPGPIGTNLTLVSQSAGSAYALTNTTAPLVFGTAGFGITLTTPGTYLIFSNLSFQGTAVTTGGFNGLNASLKRQNNTPFEIVHEIGVFGVPAQTAFTGTFVDVSLPVCVYTTLLSTDVININAHYTGSAPGSGTLEVPNANITAVKISY